MSEAKKRLLEEFEEVKGQIVIDCGSLKLKRLIAILEDPEDYYYVFWNGQKVTLSSTVIGLTRLKGFINDRHYERYKYWDAINSYDQEESFNYRDCPNKDELIKKVKEEVEHKYDNRLDKFITEICWDIN